MPVRDGWRRFRIAEMRGVTGAFAGNVCYAACQWGLLSILGRDGGAEAMGEFVFALAIVGPVFLLGNMQLRNQIATDAARRLSRRYLFSVRYTTNVLCLAVILAILTVVDARLVVVLGLGVAKAFDGITDIILGELQAAGKHPLCGALWAINGLSSLVAVFLTTSVGGLGVVGAAWGSCAGSALTVAIACILRSSEIPASLGEGLERPSLATGIRLGVGALLVSVNANIPRYVLSSAGGEYALGLLAAGTSFVTAGNTAINAIGQVLITTLSRHWGLGQVVEAWRRLAASMLFAVLLSLSGILMSILFARPILRLAFGAGLEEAETVLQVALGTTLVLYPASVLSNASMALRLYRMQVPVLAMTSAATLVGCVVLVRQWGVHGVVVGAAAGMSVQALLFGLAIGKRLNACGAVRASNSLEAER